jgi:hypothetical protein
MRGFFINSLESTAIGLCIARLGFWLDAPDSGLHLVVPPAHAKFLQVKAGSESPLTAKGDLVLLFRNETLPVTKRMGRAPLVRSENWEIWLDDGGGLIFAAPRPSPPVWIVMNPDFKSGEVFGDFSSINGDEAYPIQNLEIKLFANWLARYSDIILHASGLMIDQKGYAFLGSAGAGKSTLASSLAGDPNILVLGEDQVILRYLENRFWIFGTPWHLRPWMCSPYGAPLEKLFFLDRESAPGVKALSPMEGITRILQTAFIPYYRTELVAGILDRLTQLTGQVPAHSLSYRIGSDVSKLIHEA